MVLTVRAGWDVDAQGYSMLRQVCYATGGKVRNPDFLE